MKDVLQVYKKMSSTLQKILIFQHELLQNLRIKVFLLNLCQEILLNKQDLLINIQNLESLGTKSLISEIAIKWLRKFYFGNLTGKLNNKSLYGHEILHLLIYSDASNTGLASAYKKYGNLNMCKKNFSVIEETKSSTQRVLEAIRYSLDSMKNLLRNKHVKQHTDNYASSIIAKSGNNKREFQQLQRVSKYIETITFLQRFSPPLLDQC